MIALIKFNSRSSASKLILRLCPMPTRPPIANPTSAFWLKALRLMRAGRIKVILPAKNMSACCVLLLIWLQESLRQSG